MTKAKAETVQAMNVGRGFSSVRFFQNYGIIFVFILLCVVLAIMQPTFARADNILNVMRQVSINGVLAIGMTFVIITGGIDLSVGSLVAFTGVITAGMIRGNTPIVGAIGVGILCCVILGVINGIFVSRWKLAPFIVTLAMMTVARGLTFIYSEGQPISGLPQSFLFIGKGNIDCGLFYFPIPALTLIIVFIIGQFVLSYTSFGRYVYAVGGNEYASIVSGINANWIKIAVYTICGFLAGIASIILTARVAVGLPQAGQGYELDAIAAVVIGGTSLSGGKGRLWGTIIGALILGVLSNGLDLLGVGSFYQQVIKGLIILAAVLLDISRRK